MTNEQTNQIKELPYGTILKHIKELNFIEKDALIRNSPIDAYYKLVSNENYTYYSDAMEIAEASMTELSGCHSTEQHLIAVKYVLLQMLRKNLL